MTKKDAVLARLRCCGDASVSGQMLAQELGISRAAVWKIIKTLQGEGIPTVVWLCPILPFLNDTPENISAILEACADAGVKGIIHFGMGLTLREGNREYFYAALDRYFPGLKARYVRAYGNAYELPSPRHRELERLFHSTCEARGLWHDNGQIFRYLREFEESTDQLSFF